MKRVISIFLLLTAMLFSLGACGTGHLKIDQYEWTLRYAMCGEDGNLEVPAVGEVSSAYPEAKVVEIKLIADKGKITVIDLTNDKTYDGMYKTTGINPNGTDYEVTIDGKSGYATVAMTEYYGGSEEPTLPINLGDYSLYFYAE